MIISASRRTDIPSYYSEWLLNRFREGFVLTRNPMNHGQISRVPLSLQLIDCIVFWTKDPGNILERLQELDRMGYPYYFQFTITPYGRDMERNLRDKKDIVDTFITLSKRLGRERVLWRYDPVILNEILTLDYHRHEFEKLCRQLCGYTDVCTISFVDLYPKLSRVVKDGLLRDIQEEEMLQLAEFFCETGKKYGIEIRACSEKTDLSSCGIRPAACIDRELVQKICGYPLSVKPDKNQRPGCGCIQSIDIGAYNTCGNGCIYCYANFSENLVSKNMEGHDPKSDILIGTVGPGEIVKERKIASFRTW